MKILLLSIITASLLALPALAFAQVQTVTGQAASELQQQNETFLQEAGLTNNVRLSQVVANIIRVVLTFLGIVFLCLIVYAGFTWMTAAGNESKIDRAKTVMVSAIIGLAIVLGAYAITYFVVDKAVEATRGGVGLD